MAPYTGRFAEPAVEDCQEPIAVIGMGCRWPGEIESPSELWDFLINKKSGHSDRVPSSRFNIDAHYHPNNQRPGSFNVLGGYFLSGDLRDFDPSVFGISPVEAMWLDPQQRKLLEVVFECLESSGVTMDQISGTQTGCFVGTFTNDFQQMSTKEADFRHSYAATGVDPGLISNRVSHVFNLAGPSFTINTACSSSVYAIHQACNALRMGDCTASIVGGTNLILTVDQHINTAKLGVLSPTSRCHTFNAHANGYGRGEGVGALYLKRLSDALRDGDPIRAVIRGSAVNSNGKVPGAGITHPSLEGQSSVIREAYRLSGGLNPLLTGYFECHGTGTAVGDPLEVEALSQVMAPGRSTPLIIGAVKASIGHCEAASGIAAVMKAVLAVEKGIIPATYGFTNPNPNIKWDEWKVMVNADAVPWPKELPIRRASVNSFGYGGTNAHIIIEAVDSVAPGYAGRRKRGLARKSAAGGPRAYVSPADALDEGYKSGLEVAQDHVRAGTATPKQGSSAFLAPIRQPAQPRGEPDLTDSEEPGAAAAHAAPAGRKQFLLPFSAHEPETLRKNIARIAAVAGQHELLDLSYTLSGRRSHQEKRAFAVATSSTLEADMAEDSLIFGDAKDALPAKAAFIFTGQGAQWPRMGSALIAEFPSFRQTIQQLDAVLGRLSDAPPWTLEGALMAPPKESRVNEVALSQPLCTAIQIALLALLESWNITPIATIGHSSGEIAAACGAGFISTSEAIIIAYYRGKVVSENKRQGAMLAVGLGSNEVGKYLAGLEGKVVIACHNSSASVTLSGDSVGIALVSQRLEADNIFNRKLMTDGRAYHSHHMKPLATLYESLVETALNRLGINRNQTNRKARMISSVTGQELHSIDSGYWSRNLTGSVLFDTSLAELLRQETSLTHLLELGPHGALGGPTRQILKDCVANIIYEPTLSRNSDGVECLLQLAGKLFLKNFPVDLVSVNSIEKLTGEVTVLEHGKFLVDLPRYQWTYKKLYWAENRPSVEVRTINRARHDVLGRKVFGASDMEPVWRNILRNKDLPWLKDHQIGPDTIFPGAGHWAMAVEAVTQIHEESGEDQQICGYKLRELLIGTALVIPDNDDGIEVLLNMRKVSTENGQTWYAFSVKSVENGNWKEHSSGLITAIKAHHSIKKDLTSRPLRHVSTGKQWYKAFRGVGFHYGPNFQGLDEIRTDPGCMEATAKIPIKRESGAMLGESRYALHPSTIDNCLQLALISIYSGRFGYISSGFVPVKANEIIIHLPKESASKTGIELTPGNGFARTTTKGVRSAQCSVQLMDGEQTLLKINGLRVVAYEAAVPHSSQDISVSEPYWQSCWVPDFESTLKQPSTVASLDGLTQMQKFNKLAEVIMVKQPGNKVLEVVKMKDNQPRENAYYRPQNCQHVYGYETEPDSEVLAGPPYEPSSDANESILLDDLIEEETKFDLILCQNEPSSETIRKLPELLSNRGSVLLMSEDLSSESELKGHGLVTRLNFSSEGSSLLLMSRLPEVQQAITKSINPQEILIVHYEANFEAIKILESTAVAHGHSARVIRLEDYSEAAAKNVILLLDQRRPFLANINAILLTQLKVVLRTAESIIWLTNGTIAGSSRPEGAMVLGFRRSLAAEQPSLKLKVIDVNIFNEVNVNTVLSQFNTPSVDDELMVADGVLHVNRLVPHNPANELHQTSKSKKADMVEFVGQRLTSILGGGAHPSVEFEIEAPSASLASGQVEIFIRASGVNAEDSQVLSGGVDHMDIRREFSGVVTKVASDVTDLRIGDAVCGICNDLFSTFQTVPSSICQKISAYTQEDFEIMASVPIAYTTAHHALMNVARIEAGERIIVTGDTGFSGQVAIRLAQAMNAQVFVSANSIEEVEKLREEFSLAESQVIYCPVQNLQEEIILDLTEGLGFDVIFTGGSNNLQDFWRTIAPGGRLVHIGPTNISQFDSAPFTRGATFSCIDMRTLFLHKLRLLCSLWKDAFQTCSQLENITIKPQAFSLQKIIDAVNSCSNRLTDNKRVITYREGDLVPVRADKNQPILNKDATYLLVGCLGGLGRSLANWMIQKGARHLVFLSRTGDDKPEAAQLIDDIQSQGVTAMVIRGDAAVRQDVERARYSVPASRPIRGIVQAATVFEDALFESLEIDGMTKSFHAKVNGTRNLHKVFLNHHLDFFVMTSSISATLGTPGQTNYAAGNSYLDYLARHRISRGLPATSLILPMILGIGYVSERPEVEDGLLRKGLYGIDEEEVLDAFEMAITGFPGQHPEIIVGMDPSRLSKALKEGTTSDPFWFNDSRLCGIKAAITSGNSSMASQGAGASHGKIVDRLRQDFGSAATAELLVAATEHIKDKISRMMVIPLDEISPARSVQYYGVDSSIGTELRTWIFNEFNVDLSIQTMLNPTMSLAGLAEHLCEKNGLVEAK